LMKNLNSFKACAVARDRINKRCFAGGDIDHRQATIDAWLGFANCSRKLSELTP